MQKRRFNISRGVLYGLVTVYASLIAVVIIGILYTDYVNERNNQRWCSVLVSIDSAYEDALNNLNITPAGRKIGEEFHRLRVEFRC